MAFEINDLKGILILVLFAIPMVASTNIDCNGRAFHCVNSTHFMICVDLGGGVSTTIDDFVIPCPETTVCNVNNIFECDFPIEPMPPLQVIGVNKQSDTSEPTLVTNSVATPTETSEILSVFNENITATTLPIPEEVMHAVKLEVPENIKNLSEGNNHNTAETSAPSIFIGSTNKTVKDKETSNNTLTSTEENSKNLASAVERSILEAENASSTDKSTAIDTVISVIGLINLISTDPPIVVSTTPSSNVLTSLDSSYDIIATTTEQYITKDKEVTIYTEQIKNDTKNITMPTEIIFAEISTSSDEVSATPVVNLIVNKINIKFDNMNNTNSSNNTIAEQNNFGKSNNTNNLLPETTTEYLAPIKTINISEPVPVHLSPQTTTGNAFGLLGQVEIISAEPKQSLPGIKDYTDTSYGNTATTTTTDLFTTNLETTLSEKPVTEAILSTAPMTNLIVRNMTHNDSTPELNLTSDRIIETVQETKTKYYVPESITVSGVPSTTEKTSVQITTETNVKYTTGSTATSEAIFNNESHVEKPTTVTQPLEIVISTDSPAVVTDNLYQINGDFNQTLISTKNNTADRDIINTTEIIQTVYNASGIDIINPKATEPILVLPPSEKNAVIKIMTAETLHNEFTAAAIEISNELPGINITSSVNDPLIRNVKNDTILENTTNTKVTTDTSKMTFNVSSSDILNGKETEPSTLEYITIESSTIETLQNEFIKPSFKNKNGSPAQDLMIVHTIPPPHTVTSGPITDIAVKDLTSQSKLETKPHTGFTPEIIAHMGSDGYNSVDQGSTPKAITQPDSLKVTIFPEDLNDDHWNNNVLDVVSTTATNLNNIENRVTTPSGFTENNDTNDIGKSGNRDKSSTTSLANTQEISLELIGTSTSPSNHYVTELTSTLPETIHTTKKIFEQIPKNIQRDEDIYVLSTTDYKIDTSSSFPVDYENVPDALTTTLPHQELLKNIDFNISNQQDLVNITKEDSNVNKIEPLNLINDEHSVNATSLASSAKTNKEESIKIVSALDIVKPLSNTMPIEMLQLTSTNPSLSNDYNKTSESQASNIYVTATDNVLDNKSYLVESATQKNPEVMVLFTEKNVTNTDFFPSNLQVTVTNKEQIQYESTKSPILSAADVQHPATTPADYVTEKTNNYFSTGSMLSQLNKMPYEQIETSTSSVSSVPDMSVTFHGLTTVPINDENTTIKNIVFKMVTDNNIKMSSEPPSLTLKVMAPETYKLNTGSSLSVSALTEAQLTTEPTPKTNEFAQTTLIDSTNNNQNIQPAVRAINMPQYITSTVNNNIHPSMPSLQVPEDRVLQMTNESTHTTFVQASPLDKTSQNLHLVLNTTDLPQYVTSTENNNVPQSTSLPIVEVIAAQRNTEPTPRTIFAQTMPLDKTSQNAQPALNTKDLLQYVTSTENNNVPQSTSLPIVEVTAAQRNTEPTPGTIFAQTMPLDKTSQNAQPALNTTDLLQYVTSTVNNNNPQSTSLPIVEVTGAHRNTESTPTTIFAQTMPIDKKNNNQNTQPAGAIDIPQYVTSTVNHNIPPSMPSLQVMNDTVSQMTTESTHATLFQATPHDKTSQNAQVVLKSTDLPQFVTSTENNNVLQSMPSLPIMKVIAAYRNTEHLQTTIFAQTTPLDHENIVVGASSKNYGQNTSITSARSVDNNKAEIVNHTESNWMSSDVNIDSVKIKESPIKEKDLKNFGLKSDTDLDSATISKIQAKNGKSDDEIEYRLTTVITDYKQAKAPNNVTQSKTIVKSENKNAAIHSSVNTNIEIFDVKTNNVQVDSKNISNSYSLNNTKATITTSSHNLSLQNSAINDELEQHLISANHTVTTEVQSHLNESDKQSNKTNYELSLNGVSVHNPNLTSTKLNNASNRDTGAITVPASVFNCSNHVRGKYSDKKDCRKFYTCVGHLQPMVGTCPNNTVFSEINKQCTRNLSHCVRNNQFTCLLEGRFSDFFIDNIYYICVKNRNNHFIRFKLQCQDDYHLNKDLIKCEKNEGVSTQSGSSVSETINDESELKPKSEKNVSSDDFECVKEGKFPNTKDFNKYYICVKNTNNQFIRYKLQCQNGYYLNKIAVKCEKNEEILTQSVSIVAETINVERKPKLQSEKIVSLDDFECEKEGKFPHGKDCSKYYVCTKVKNVYRRKVTKCASDDVFDKKKKKCVESDSGEC